MRVSSLMHEGMSLALVCRQAKRMFDIMLAETLKYKKTLTASIDIVLVKHHIF